jgi:DNA polymerase IV
VKHPFRQDAMPKFIMHLDMDAFFAAIEQRDNPALKGKPVIIGALPGGRGVVSTASYEARKFGVRSAMPISEAYRRCPDGIFLRPNGRKYVQASEQVGEILKCISPQVEMASIDEAYIDITGSIKLLGSPGTIAMLVKDRIKSSLLLTASVGIGPNRLIAKIASDMNKPDGLTIVKESEVLEFLSALPVSKIPGIGKKAEEALNKLGIFYIGQLRARSERELISRFGESMGGFLFNKSRGISSDEVGREDIRKSISKERTFGEDTQDSDRLHRTLLNLSSDIGRTARKEGLSGRTITLKIRLEGFETHTRSHSYDTATDTDDVIFQRVWDLFSTSPWTEKPVRLIGVGLSDLSNGTGAQLSLFTPAKTLRSKKVHAAIDRIKDRFGKKAILPAQAVEPADKEKK